MLKIIKKKVKKRRLFPLKNGTPHAFRKKELNEMNFYSKKFRKFAAGLILLVIFAMVATMVIPYLI